MTREIDCHITCRRRRTISRGRFFAGNLRDRDARLNLLPVLDHQLSAGRNHEVAQTLLLAAGRLPDLDVRVQLLFAILNHDALPETGQLIELLGDRLVLHQVDEANGAVDVRIETVRLVKWQACSEQTLGLATDGVVARGEAEDG